MDEGTQREAASLIKNIFRYLDKDARDIMTHRKNIVAIDGEELLEDAFRFMLGESFSRFPIYHEDIDEIVGFPPSQRSSLLLYEGGTAEDSGGRTERVHKTGHFLSRRQRASTSCSKRCRPRRTM